MTKYTEANMGIKMPIQKIVFDENKKRAEQVAIIYDIFYGDFSDDSEELFFLAGQHFPHAKMAWDDDLNGKDEDGWAYFFYSGDKAVATEMVRDILATDGKGYEKVVRPTDISPEEHLEDMHEEGCLICGKNSCGGCCYE